MVFRLVAQGKIDRAVSLLETSMSCFDTIDDPDFYYDRDEILQNRSAFELVREQLTDTQRAELDQIDTHWRANPADFNSAFKAEHAWHNTKTALKGFVLDEHGKTPEIPADHWWWNPLEVK